MNFSEEITSINKEVVDIYEDVEDKERGSWDNGLGAGGVSGETSEVSVNYASLQWKGKRINSNFRKSCITTSCPIKYSLNRETLILNSDETYTPRQRFDYSIKEKEHKLDVFQCEVTSKKSVDLAIELHWKLKSPNKKL